MRPATTASEGGLVGVPRTEMRSTEMRTNRDSSRITPIEAYGALRQRLTPLLTPYQEMLGDIRRHQVI